MSTARPPFPDAIISQSASLINISAQVGSTKNGIIPACFESQIQLALLKLRRVILAAGASVSDISKLTVSIVDHCLENNAHERHLHRFLGLHRPAITLIPVPRLAVPECLVEIDAVLCKGPSLIPVLTTSTRTPTSSAEKTYDVIVVGAGLSGLAAARDVTQAGLSCLVLEARDRVGGKTLSRPMEDGDGIVELGAAWMNDTTETRMIALARKYGAELLEQNVKGNVVLQDLSGMCSTFPYGELPQFDAKTQEHLEYISNIVDEDCQNVDIWNPKDSELDSLNLASYLRLKKGATDIALNTVSTWTRAMLGQEPRDISTLYFLNYCKSFGDEKHRGLLQLRSDEQHGGQHIRIRQGVQMISRGLASELPPHSIRFAEPVLSLDQTSPKLVHVTTPSFVISARKVILAVPTPIYKTLTFHPPLPHSKAVLADSFHFGYYTKVMFAFKSPFWAERGFCGLAQSFLGPAGIFRDVSVPPDNKWVLVAFLAGDNGYAWSLLPPEERQEQLLAQIARLFANREVVDKEFVGSISHDWSTEQYSGWGCPSPSLGPGALDTFGEALREPVGNIHFVGVETAGEFKGFMEGAVRSGERGAAEVLGSLGRTQARL